MLLSNIVCLYLRSSKRKLCHVAGSIDSDVTNDDSLTAKNAFYIDFLDAFMLLHSCKKRFLFLYKFVVQCTNIKKNTEKSYHTGNHYVNTVRNNNKF